jgi:outer membrane usher protein
VFGTAGSIAYEYSGRRGGLAFAARRATTDYATLATRDTLDRMRMDLAGQAGLRLTGRVSLGATLLSRSYYTAEIASPIGNDAPAASRVAQARRAAMTTTIGMGRRTSLYLSATRELMDHRWTTGAYAGLGVALDHRRAVTASIERVGDRMRATIDTQQALPIGSGLGYRVQSSAGDAASASLDAELSAQSSFGRYALRQMVVNGQSATLLDASGGLVFIGGAMHATRPVQDGFALVRVPGVPSVRTYVSHQEVGRTNRHGDLVVNGLLPYYGNRLSIADTDVPLDRDVQRNEALVAPPYRGGALALFPAPRPWRVTGRIMILRGTEVLAPLGARLTVTTQTGSLETWLGSEGGFYLEGLAPGRYDARVTLDGVACAVALRVPDSNSPVIRTEPLTCAAGSGPQPEQP